MSELNPCPFCGSNSVTLHRHRSNSWRPQCDGCFANINPHGASREVAIDLWNRRIVDPAQGAGDCGADWEQLNAAFRDALRKYPYSQHALHYLWNNAIATGPDTVKPPPPVPFTVDQGRPASGQGDEQGCKPTDNGYSLPSTTVLTTT